MTLMIPPFLPVRRIGLLAVAAFIFFGGQSLIASAEEGLANKDSKDGKWKHHIPSKVLSKHGLPEVELSWLLERRRAAAARKLLAQTPKHQGYETLAPVT